METEAKQIAIETNTIIAEQQTRQLLCINSKL